jgi:hypothetical protein
MENVLSPKNIKVHVIFRPVKISLTGVKFQSRLHYYFRVCPNSDHIEFGHIEFDLSEYISTSTRPYS